MARRKQSGAEDVIELTSKFPWWVGALLAVVSYVWLHSVASKGMPHAQGGDISGAMTGGLFYAFASLGQYVLPALFGIGAVTSVLMRMKRKKLHGEVSAGDRIVSDISWQDFELLIGEYFRRQGFSVKETGPGADGGVDLVLRKKSAKYLVQCKHYKAYKVGVKPVRELLGVMASSGAAGGFVVTSGQFTKDAVAFAKDNNIKLLDGKALNKILKQTPTSIGTKSPKPDTAHKIPDQKAEEVAQVCLKCGSPMVERVAKKGSRAGQKFLGCSKFPSCRFTLPIE
jgi:restriction system protein